jgi:glutathione S-transferase
MQPNCNMEELAVPPLATYASREYFDDDGVLQVEYDGPDVAEAYEKMYGAPPPMPQEKGKRGRAVRESSLLQLASLFDEGSDTSFARELRQRHRQKQKVGLAHRLSRARARRPAMHRGFRRMARRSTPSTAAGGGDPDPEPGPERCAVGGCGEREEVRYVYA